MTLHAELTFIGKEKSVVKLHNLCNAENTAPVRIQNSVVLFVYIPKIRSKDQILLLHCFLIVLTKHTFYPLYCD